MKKIAFLLLLVFPIEFLQAQDKKEDLIRYLKDNWKTPEDYIISKFIDHDYIFIGEYHSGKSAHIDPLITV